MASMDNRERILEAAAQVYAQHGFRGATTRLIAQAAGVNEVTLFRIFGSKAQLFDEFLHHRMSAAAHPALPDVPRDPQHELTEWCATTLAHLRESRSLVRKMIGEMEERPLAAAGACEGSHQATRVVLDYVRRMRERGLVHADPDDDAVAASMLMGALFGDAVSREIVPAAFPTSEAEAPAQYVRCFLRMLGVEAAAAHEQATRRRASA